MAQAGSLLTLGQASKRLKTWMPKALCLVHPLIHVNHLQQVPCIAHSRSVTQREPSIRHPSIMLRHKATNQVSAQNKQIRLHISQLHTHSSPTHIPTRGSRRRTAVRTSPKINKRALATNSMHNQLLRHTTHHKQIHVINQQDHHHTQSPNISGSSLIVGEPQREP